ncbi:MAG TPA: hypothetical protein VF540_08160 [Segetibacter sp.]
MTFTSCKLCGQPTEDFLAQFELLRCNKCNLIFFKHRLSAKYVKELYDKLYNKQEDYAAYKMQAEQLQSGEQPNIGYDKIMVLNRLFETGCKEFMEIGAGVGIVGKYLEGRGYGYEGLELDTQAATLAARAGINVKNRPFNY